MSDNTAISNLAFNGQLKSNNDTIFQESIMPDFSFDSEFVEENPSRYGQNYIHFNFNLDGNPISSNTIFTLSKEQILKDFEEFEASGDYIVLYANGSGPYWTRRWWDGYIIDLNFDQFLRIYLEDGIFMINSEDKHTGFSILYDGDSAVISDIKFYNLIRLNSFKFAEILDLEFNFYEIDPLNFEASLEYKKENEIYKLGVNLDSVELTGIPTAPTPYSNANDNQITNKKYVGDKIQEIYPINSGSTDINSILTISDGIDNGTVESIEINFEPIQDLNGYDAAWPAGATKNQLPVPNDEIKVVNDIRVSCKNGVYTVSGISTVETTVFFDLPTTIDIPAGKVISMFNDYQYSGSGDWHCNLVFRDINGQNGFNIDMTSINRKYTLDRSYSGIAKIGINHPRGNIGTVTLSPMIVDTLAEADSYIPYKNICPISGWTNANIVITDANIYPTSSWSRGKIDDRTGELIPDANSNFWYTNNKIIVKPSTSYRFCIATNASGRQSRIFAYDINDNYIGYYQPQSDKWLVDITDYSSMTYHPVFTTPINTAYIRICRNISTYLYNNFSINYPASIEDRIYENASVYSMTWADTVYGGTLGYTKNGFWKIYSQYEAIDLGTLSWTRTLESENEYYFNATISGKKSSPNTGYCSIYKFVSNIDELEDKEIGYSQTQIRVKDNDYTDAETFTAAMSGQTLVCERNTSNYIYISDDPVPVMRANLNNIFTDIGALNIQYRETIEGYVDRKIAEIPSASGVSF